MCGSIVHHLPQDLLRLGQHLALLPGEGGESALDPLVAAPPGLADVFGPLLGELDEHRAAVAGVLRAQHEALRFEELHGTGHRRWAHVLAFSAFPPAEGPVGEYDREHRKLPLCQGARARHAQAAAGAQDRHSESSCKWRIAPGTYGSWLRGSHTLPIIDT